MLVLIDEINRGDVARIFGELITYIELDKRGRNFFIAQQPGVVHSIPSNIYFIGTMNTADKSVSLLDVALRRRFAFREFRPDPGVFERNSEWLVRCEGIEVGSLLSGLNDRLREIGISDDQAVGHALLSVPSTSDDPLRDLISRFEFDIYPLVEEYCYFDRQQIRKVLGGLVDHNGRWSPSADRDKRLDVLRDLAGTQRNAATLSGQAAEDPAGTGSDLSAEDDGEIAE